MKGFSGSLWEAHYEEHRAVWQDAIPHLAPQDVFFILVLENAYRANARDAIPTGKAIVIRQVMRRFYFSILELVEVLYREGGDDNVLLPPGFERTPSNELGLWLQFNQWLNDVHDNVMEGKAPDDDRHRAIARISFFLRRLGFLPSLVTGDYLRAVIKQGLRKGRLSELGDAPEQNISKLDVIAEIFAMDGAKGMIFERDDAGRAILVPNFAGVFDALARCRRGEPKVTSLDVDSSSAEGKHLQSALPGTGASIDPGNFAAMLELVRALRELRERCTARGAASVAAFDYVLGGKSRREVSMAFGVTPKQIRVAEGWIRQQAACVPGWSDLV